MNYERHEPLMCAHCDLCPHTSRHATGPRNVGAAPRATKNDMSKATAADTDRRLKANEERQCSPG